MSKNITDVNEAARIASSAIHGATIGRFSGAHPNESNCWKDHKIVNPMEETKAVEMQEGKKYLMVINVPRNLPQQRIEAIQNSVPVYDNYFRARGIDMTLMVTDEPIQIFELG